MKHFYLILILSIFTLNIYAQESSTSTYYLIRHAEKDRSDKTNKDPGLTEEGKKRASAWSDIFVKCGIDAIYSTNYKRTYNTVKKMQFVTGVKEIKIYHPFKLDFENFLNETKGKNVVIVGHSNKRHLSLINLLVVKCILKLKIITMPIYILSPLMENGYHMCLLK